MKTALVLAAAVCSESGGCVHSTGGADVSDNRFDRLPSDWFGAEYSGYFTFKATVIQRGRTERFICLNCGRMSRRLEAGPDYVSSVGAGETRTVSIL